MLFTIQTLLLEINNITQALGTSKPEAQGWSTSDYISCFAALVSILSIVFSYYSVYKSKHLEIRYAAFEKLGIENINQMFEPIDNIFKNNRPDLVGIHLNTITDLFTDIDLYLIEFKGTYDTLEISKVINIKEDFTDALFLVRTRTIGDYKIKYLATKTKMIHELYIFALESNHLWIWRAWAWIKAKIW